MISNIDRLESATFKINRLYFARKKTKSKDMSLDELFKAVTEEVRVKDFLDLDYDPENFLGTTRDIWIRLSNERKSKLINEKISKPIRISIRKRRIMLQELLESSGIKNPRSVDRGVLEEIMTESQIEDSLALC